MMSAPVHLDITGQTATITLDRPPVNALDLPMLEALVGAIRAAGDDPRARVIILKSANPRIFSGGLDLRAIGGKSRDELRPYLQLLYVDMHQAQRAAAKPTIAQIAGDARGGGMTLAILCDMIVASETATFGYPEIDRGVVPAIHFGHLATIVGRNRAFDLLFTGRSFDAAEAHHLGLVTRLARADALDATVAALATTLSAKPPNTVARARAQFAAQSYPGFAESVAEAADFFCDIASSDEAHEGLRAFTEKRTPDWAKVNREA